MHGRLLLRAGSSPGRAGDLQERGTRAAFAGLANRLLIKREGLEIVPGSDRIQAYSGKDIAKLLETKGPILFYWTKTAGAHSYGHASVIVGADTDKIVYHDPEFRNSGGKNLKMDTGSFNTTRLYNPGVYGMLQRESIRDREVLKTKKLKV